MRYNINLTKEHIIFFSLFIFIVTISDVIALAPNPGHGWNQVECDNQLCVKNNKIGIGTTNPLVNLHFIDTIGWGLRIQDSSALSLYLDLRAGNDVSRQAVIRAPNDLVIRSTEDIIMHSGPDNPPVNPFEFTVATIGALREPELKSAGNLHLRSEAGNIDLDIGPLHNPPFRITSARDIELGQRFGEVKVRLRGSLVEENNKPVYFVSVDSDECGGVHSYLGCPIGFNKAGKWRVNGGSCDSGSLSGTGYENGNIIRGWMVLCVAS